MSSNGVLPKSLKKYHYCLLTPAKGCTNKFIYIDNVSEDAKEVSRKWNASKKEKMIREGYNEMI